MVQYKNHGAKTIVAGSVHNRIFLTLVAFAALASGSSALSTEVAVYSGAISKEHNRQFFAAVEGQPVTRLVITSGGGAVEAGIELGLWVFERRLSIEVVEYCLSSCANYIFPAGRLKTIRPGAIVAWHGNYRHLQQTGLWRDDIAGRMERYGEDAATAAARVRTEVDRLVRLEKDFFAHIGVNEYLCWIGKMPPFDAPNYYFLSPRDMARFGLTAVEAPGDYGQTDVSTFSDHIMYISLDGAGAIQE